MGGQRGDGRAAEPPVAGQAFDELAADHSGAADDENMHDVALGDGSAVRATAAVDEMDLAGGEGALVAREIGARKPISSAVPRRPMGWRPTKSARTASSVRPVCAATAAMRSSSEGD